MNASLDKIPQNDVRSKAAPQLKTFDIDSLRELLRYEPETGDLFWRDRARKWFSADRHWSAWNKRYAGQRVSGKSGKGYAVVSLGETRILAHRVIWAMLHGEWPIQIDHIDGDRRNNRLSNLRSVTNLENARNRRVASNNKSGHMGIIYLPKKGRTPERWEAFVQWKHLGRFFSLEEALEARKAAVEERGFHPNHGRSA